MALNSPDILVLVLLPMSLDLRGGHKLHFESIDLRALSLLIILCPGRRYFLRLRCSLAAKLHLQLPKHFLLRL